MWFERRFELPDTYDADGVKADLSDGGLTLHLPKVPEAQPRKIAIGA